MIGNISKSAKKRRFKQEEEAARELALLSENDLKKLDITEDVKKEVRQCRGLKGGARKRQVKYLAKVMREDSVQVVLDFLATRKGSKLKSNKLQQKAEEFRDQIINEAMACRDNCIMQGLDWELDWPSETLDGVVERLELDEKDLRRSIDQYVRTRLHNHYREVFRMLKAAFEKEELKSRLAQEAVRE